MYWVDPLVGLGAGVIPRAELQLLAREIGELGFSYHEVTGENIEQVLAAGVCRERVRPVILPEREILLELHKIGISLVRLGATAPTGQAGGGFFALARQLKITVWLTLDVAAIPGDRNALPLSDAGGVHFVGGRHMADPRQIRRYLAQWQNAGVLRYEFSGSNDCGLGAANALSAIQAGAAGVMAAVGGIDGGIPWEEVLAARTLLLRSCGELDRELVPRCRRVLEIMHQEVAVNKAVLGANVFAHESGIHVDGIAKNPVLYEPFSPEQIGQQRKIVLGAHSGRAAVAQQLQQLGLPYDEGCLGQVVRDVQELAKRQGFGIYCGQLGQLYWQGREREVSVCEGVG